jgi:hypothetical protein
MGTLRSSAWPAGLGVALGVALGLAVAQLGRDTTRALDDAAGIQRQYAPVLALDGTAKQEILAIARLLQHQPGMAIDFSAAPSRQYCLAPGAGSMVHFTVEPGRAAVDIVYFHDAAPLLATGLAPGKLATQPASIAEMKPGIWYYNDGARVEPFHGRTLGHPMLVLGVAAR